MTNEHEALLLAMDKGLAVARQPRCLIDGEAANAESPDTFDIPQRYDRETVEPGTHVKVGVSPEGEMGERFWVMVDVVVKRTLLNAGQPLSYAVAFEGVVDNLLVTDAAGLKLGSRIKFLPKHVLSIMSADDEDEVPEDNVRIVCKTCK